MTAPDPYRWPANDRGVIHPGINAPGDCCNCKRCARDEMTRWVKAGRPEQPTAAERAALHGGTQ